MESMVEFCNTPQVSLAARVIKNTNKNKKYTGLCNIAIR